MGIALLVPVGLPAGGGITSKKVVLINKNESLLVSSNSLALLSSPNTRAPILRQIEEGTPISILRFFQDNNGMNWTQIKVSSIELTKVKSIPRRGWVQSQFDRRI